MVMWKINMDAGHDFEYVDIHRTWEKIDVISASTKYVEIEGPGGIARRLSRNDQAYRIFEAETDAQGFYFASTMKLKQYLKGELSLANKRLMNWGPGYGKRPRVMVKVTYPDGKLITCTKKRAMEIVGFKSLSGLTAAMDRGSISRQGFRVERETFQKDGGK